MATIEIHVRPGCAYEWRGLDGAQPPVTLSAPRAGQKADPRVRAMLRVELPDKNVDQTLAALQATAVGPNGAWLATFSVCDTWRDTLRTAHRQGGPWTRYEVQLVGDPACSVVQVPDQHQIRALTGEAPITAQMNAAQHAAFTGRYRLQVRCEPKPEPKATA